MAGGLGTRGRPYTEYFPKAMTPVRGRPLVSHIARYAGSFGFIDGIVIVTDLEGLGGQIRNYYSSRNDGVRCPVTFVQDSQSGTGGDLLHIRDELGDDGQFVLWFVDNLCAVDLEGMYRRFQNSGSMACVATRSKRAEETGFAKVDNFGIVTEFMEKPVIELPVPECLGVYILDSAILARVSYLMDASSSSSSSSITSRHRKKSSGTDTADVRTSVNLSSDILEDLSREGAISAFDIGDAEWIDMESPAVMGRNGARIDRIVSRMNLEMKRRGP